MPRVRTAGDEARWGIARQRDELLSSGRNFPSREEVVRKSRPTFDEVLANATNEDILALSDDDALFIYEFDPGINGTRLTGDYLLSRFVGWDPDDVFFSMESDAPRPAPPAKKALGDGVGDGDGGDDKPPLPQGELERYYAYWSTDPENADFSWPQLASALKAQFPNHHVTRKRYRALDPGRRKRGRKPRS